MAEEIKTTETTNNRVLPPEPAFRPVETFGTEADVPIPPPAPVVNNETLPATETSENGTTVPPAPITKKDQDTEPVTDEKMVKMILDEITSKDETTGYTPCAIAAVLERIHNVYSPDGISDDDDREQMSEVDPEYCTIDIYSLGTDITTVNIIFDSRQDAYLTELYNLLEKYRMETERLQQKLSEGDPSITNPDIPRFSLAIVPYKFEGQAIASFEQPISYFKALDGSDEKGERAMLTLLFSNENMGIQTFELSDEYITELTAEILREYESKDVIYHSSY